MKDPIELIPAEAEHVLGRYVTADDTVVFDTPAHVVTARKP